MANYMASARTNYFRVTDEEKYKELFNGLCGEDDIADFTKEENGVVYHGFGSYCSIEYCAPSEEDDDYEYNFDAFLDELQKILPDDEVFVYMEAGNEKLRYVSGYVIVMTNKECKSMSLDNWARQQAKQMLNNDDFETQMTY